jgi:sorting nexin-9/18/33
MATLPRSPKSSKFVPSAAAQRRPHSDFDAGINASTAWTEHLETTGSLSDEEPDDEEGTHRPARALYDFEGKTEFRELSVDAGDELEVVKEDLADGWSLVKNEAGEVGLLPRTYYTVRLVHGGLDLIEGGLI